MTTQTTQTIQTTTSTTLDDDSDDSDDDDDGFCWTTTRDEKDPPNPRKKTTLTTKKGGTSPFVGGLKKDIPNTTTTGHHDKGRRRRRRRLFVDRLIEDVAKVDFAAPAPAYLENDLGQSNVRRYLLEPGPKDGSHSRCRIVRKKDAFGYCTYVLYADCPPPPPPPPPPRPPPSGSSGVLSSMQEEGAKGQNGKSRRHGRFEARALCAARKRKKSRRSRMVVSLDVTDIRESSSQYLGKIAATNAAGTRFELFDDGGKPGTWETFERSVREDYEDYSEEEDQENEDHKDKSSREDEHNEEEEEEEEDDDDENDDLTEVKNRTRLGTVEYNLNPLGIHGPRQMRVEIVNTEETKEVTDDDDTTKPVIARFKNVLPTWNKKMSAYCLNFNARVTKPSVKNFQLLVDDGEEKEKEEKDGAHEDKEKNVNDATIDSSMIDDNKSIAKNAALLREKQRRKRRTRWQKWVLQFGKIGEDVYTMDFRYPFTPLQAFMVCATSLDKKLGCE